MSITKTGRWISLEFQENYGKFFPIDFFNNYNNGSFVKNNNIFTITSAITTSSWGSGVSIPRNIIIVPYGYTYRISCEINVPTTHTVVIDINNLCGNVSGNDHDVGRTSTSFNIAQDTWTTITWGSSNLNTTQNPDQLDIIVYDGIGLRTTEDTASVNWTIRNIKYVIYKNDLTIASIGKDGITHSNIFYEI